MDNKTRTRHFFIMLIVGIYLSLTVGTVATALNATPGPFLTVVAVLLGACNAAVCFLVGRKVWNDD